ncbi:hypothetical protein [Actinosynnema mirum]|uniref:Uncharacterized protein n=1 Tax=Actinosynnema mirum (strain ATCC 29888 / DSM 43827 / JCM 3225 / NBRC 14064 / NCIMB 13271 / NRRL B-12336 / IMRU 3971 / 101) TaxID=446462 RepID=C6WB96_ACTMD|nr:hypothetical protein [Actinosynnema mirum]ACU39387.1 hypothetical protein Amir_5569 [Actinosynnema mirum DSM 43827]
MTLLDGRSTALVERPDHWPEPIEDPDDCWQARRDHYAPICAASPGDHTTCGCCPTGHRTNCTEESKVDSTIRADWRPLVLASPTVSDAAVEAAAVAMRNQLGLLGDGSSAWASLFPEEQDHWREQARVVLTAALPHLGGAEQPASSTTLQPEKLRFLEPYSERPAILPTTLEAQQTGQTWSLIDGVLGTYCARKATRTALKVAPEGLIRALEDLLIEFGTCLDISSQHAAEQPA